eukprot:GHVS01102701.1.p1 GENE.GHVS01102701.1~~GHVS01102701.1.p1  ORF type:complete len:385 (+),score=54.22 GHVS01102701.1:85-1239(+)
MTDKSPCSWPDGLVSSISPCSITDPSTIASSSPLCQSPSLPPRLISSSKSPSLFQSSDCLGGVVLGQRLVDEADIFLFDCDGVLWHGDVLIDGAKNTLEKLQEAGKQLYFVTNNSSQSRSGYLTKFRRLGLGSIVVEESQIICSAHAVAAYLVANGFKETGKKVYVIGEAGILEELSLAGIPCIGGREDSSKIVGADGLHVDSSVGCVVVGLDRQFNYYKLQYAQLCINELNADFIATNTDQLGHFTETQACAGTGGMVGAVEGCTGIKPRVIGKPNSYMIDTLRQELDKPTATIAPTGEGNKDESNWTRVRRSRMVMVGDRLDTDILFGINAGIGTVLTLSGIVNLAELQAQSARAFQGVAEREDPELSVLPDFFADSIADLV